jgi:hypothetical protein
MSKSIDRRRRERDNDGERTLDLVEFLEKRPELRKKWNEEGTKHSSYAIADWHRRARKGREKYAKSIKNASDFTLTKQSGQVTLKWEVDPADWLKFRVETDNHGAEILTDHSPQGIADRVLADHFRKNIESFLFRTAKRLFEGALIFETTKVLGVNPHSWRKRLLHEVEEDWKELTGDTQRGRKFGSVVNRLERSREAEKLAAEVKAAIRFLLTGPVDSKLKPRGRKFFYDKYEIDRALIARYLHQGSAASFGNRLYRLGLKFRKLKEEAIVECND